MIMRTLVLLGSCVLLGGCADNTRAADQEVGVQMKLKTLEKEIVIGTTEERVADVLYSLGVEFSFVSAESLMSFAVPRESDEYYETLKGRYVSIIRSVGRTALSKKDISVQIDIGLDDRVNKVKIEPIYTAP